MNEFSNLGDEIKNTVQEAVDTMNFDHLSRDISDSVRSALGEMKRTLGGDQDVSDVARDWKVGGYQNPQGSQNNQTGYGTAGNARQTQDRQSSAQRRSENAYQKQKTYTQNYHQATYGQNQQAMWEQRKRAAVERARQMKSQYVNSGNSSSYHVAKDYKNVPLVRGAKMPGKISGLIIQSIGYPLALGFGTATIVLYVLLNVGIIMDVASILVSIFAPITLASIGLIAIGRKLRSRVRRFKQYAEYIGERKFCELKELSSHTGYSVKYVLKDVRKMLQLGMFRDGHLDQEGKYLIVDRETYQQYLKTAQEYEARKTIDGDTTSKEKKAKAQEEADKKKAQENVQENEELRKTVQEGREYIRQIKEANDAIPGEDISNKLSRLEQITSKIFTFVEVHPEKLPELRKFMEYYLPITLKLVDAYKELDSQPVQGENIRNSKLEIVKSLDTINYAFENLLDSLYQSTAMEVSSDISVLEALFAQDGLTHNKDFEKDKGDNEE